jgi:hypothetical protein
MILVISTVLPAIDVTRLLVVLGSVALGVVVAGSIWLALAQRRVAPLSEMSRAERENWRMPGLALLERPRWSLPTRIAMLSMAAYIIVAVLFLVVKAVQLAFAGH